MQIAGNYQQKNPSFQMRVGISDNTKFSILQDLCSFTKMPGTTKEKEKFFRQTLVAFKKAFEKLTQEENTALEILPLIDPKSPLSKRRLVNKYCLTYKTPEGKIITSSDYFTSGELLPNASLDNNQPFSNVTKTILKILSDATEKSGLVNSDKNKNIMKAQYETLTSKTQSTSINKAA